MAFLCAYNDVVSKLLYSYKNGEEIYVICSVEGDVQFFCDKQDVEVIMYTLSLFDGKHTVEEVKEQVRQAYSSLNSDKMVDTLSRSRFMISNSSVNTSNELERNSLNLLKLDMSFLKKINHKVIDAIYYLFNILFFLSVVIILFLFISKKISFGDYFTYATETSYLNEIIFMVICGIPSIFFHESAHIITVMRYRYYPKVLGFSLQYNFFPIYYVITPGTYLLEAKKRINYHLAGVMANFILFSCFSLIAYISKDNMFYVFALSNLQLIVVNLMPFNLTDGYFLSCTLFKKVNLRLKFVNVMAFQEKFSAQKSSVKLYILFAAVYVVFLAYNMSFWFKNVISDFLGYRINNPVFDIATIILALVVMIFTVIIKSRKSASAVKK